MSTFANNADRPGSSNNELPSNRKQSVHSAESSPRNDRSQSGRPSYYGGRDGRGTPTRSDRKDRNHYTRLGSIWHTKWTTTDWTIRRIAAMMGLRLTPEVDDSAYEFLQALVDNGVLEAQYDGDEIVRVTFKTTAHIDVPEVAR